MSTTAQIEAPPRYAGDHYTGGERRALMERDAAERRVDVLAAVNARRYAAIENAVAAFAEIVVNGGDAELAYRIAMEQIVKLRMANRTRDTDDLDARPACDRSRDVAALRRSLDALDTGRCESCGAGPGEAHNEFCG